MNDIAPYDSMLEMRGYGTLRIQSDGTARVSGRGPRLYIQRPDERPIWENVEVTYYAKLHALTNDAPSHSGFKIGARSWHGVRPFDNCDGKTDYGIARFDGHATSTKELLHGESYGSQRGTDIDIPTGEWVGVKFLLRNTDNGGVRLQTFLDHTNGLDGGAWTLVAEHVDRGD